MINNYYQKRERERRKEKERGREVMMTTYNNWNPHTLLMGLKNGIATMENGMQFLKNLNTALYIIQQFHSLVQSQEGKQQLEHRFVHHVQAVFVTVAKRQKQIKCPLMDKSIYKRCDKHRIVFRLKKKIPTNVTTQVNLETLC